MKQLLSITLFLFLSASSLLAQQGMNTQRQHNSAHTTVKNDKLKITYGQPSKNGKEIFGSEIPYRKIWQAGDDEATQITFSKDCLINGFKEVKAGTYTLFVIPDAKTEWTLVLNTQLNQWGTADYDKSRDKNAYYVSTGTKQLDHTVETLTYRITDEGFFIEWDQTGVFFKTTWR